MKGDDDDNSNEEVTCAISGSDCILKTKSASYTAVASGGSTGAEGENIIYTFNWSNPSGETGGSITYSDTAVEKSVTLSCTATASTGLSGEGTKEIHIVDPVVDKIIAHCSYASTTYNGDDKAELFSGHEIDFGDPCSKDEPGQALIIFRDVVSYPNGNIRDFDIELAAIMDPENSPPHDILDESWSKVSSPASGYFDKNNTYNVKFKNPKVGGLYKIRFNFLGKEPSGANILLPLAGPDILNWLDQEVKDMKQWTMEKQAEAFYYCWDTLGSEATLDDYMDKLEEIFIKYSGIVFDYQFDALNNDGKADYCYRYAFEHNDICAARCYITVKGNVIYFAKINNMLWGLFGRYWGYDTMKLLLGADLHEFAQHIGWNVFEWRWDPATSQAGIQLGGDIYKKLQKYPHGNLSTWFSADRWKELVDDNELNEERLWPSNKPLNIQASKLAIQRPQLIP